MQQGLARWLSRLRRRPPLVPAKETDASQPRLLDGRFRRCVVFAPRYVRAASCRRDFAFPWLPSGALENLGLERT